MKRVYELAAELKVTTQNILEYLKRLGYDVARNQMQPLTDEMHLALLCKFDEKRVRQFADNRPGFDTLKDALKQRLTAIKRKQSFSQNASKGDRIPQPTSRKEEPRAEQAKITTTEYSHMEDQPMATTSPGIQDAFGNLVEALQRELKSIAKSSTGAIEKGDYEAARAPLERAGDISKLLGKFNDLRKEWDLLFKGTPVAVSVKAPTVKAIKPAVEKKRTTARLPRGVSTPLKAFIQPVLQTLVDMGGKGARIDIVNNLLKIMAGTLNELDKQSSPSHPKTPRWLIKMDKVRAFMLETDILVKDTEMGIWEISQKGRDFLKESSAK